MPFLQRRHPKQSRTPFVILLGGTLALGLTTAFAQTEKQTVPASAASATPTFTPEQISFFEKDVKPILAESCFACHAEAASGGLRLTNRAAILKGGASGPSVSLTKLEDSVFLHAINYVDRQMPPTGKLSAPKIAILTKWIGMGMPWTPGKTPDEKMPPKSGPPQVNAETMKFWAFQPVRRVAVPKVKNVAWAKNPIDAFVLAKLEAKHMTPNAPASKIALLRRVTYDVTGLPPTTQETQAFLKDTSPNAYAKVVDRLLASPHYGERWARHWLDLVRYGETNSFERDNPKPFVWRYRDYVINALNTDKPYDTFIREQLAGDELPNPTPDSLIATGYYRLGTWDDEPADPEQARYDELDDIVATTGQTFLGLTVNCARCHDHKIDPIPQKDYYRMVSFFAGTTRYGGGGPGLSVESNSLRPISNPAEQARFAQENGAYQTKLKTLDAEIEAIESQVRKDFLPVEKQDARDEGRRIEIIRKRVPNKLSQTTFDRYAELMKTRDDLRKSPPKGLEMALCVTERGRVPEASHVMLRGNPHSPGDEVTPGFLSILAPPAPNIVPPASNPNSSGRRLALANWIASPSNQLTARVMVNRLWQHHFGRGIVRSTSNFGTLGDRPTHPELLDWLAGEFVRNGWSQKKMHRLMLLSNAYQMSSTGNTKALAKDPENDLFWRFNMRRLDAEEIRDSILACDGTLNKAQGGPSVYPKIPQEVLNGQSMPGYGWPVSAAPDQARRSIYVHVKRSLALPLLASFDAADTDFSCPVRFATTQPTQALSLMNSAFVNEQARVFAADIEKQGGTTPAKSIRIALRRVMQREPTVKETERGVRFLKVMQTRHHLSQQEALHYFCVVALNLNEFIYLD